MQYVTSNGRDRGDPYSLRQTGVYQKLSSEGQRSDWILLQPCADAQEQLLQHSFGASESGTLLQDSIELHQMLLSPMVLNWDDYLETIRVRLEEFVSCFFLLANA